MRVIVVGAGAVGSSIAESLADTHHVAVVDVDADHVEDLSHSHDVLGVEGDGTDLESLETAGLEDADMLIASTDDDATNIVTCGTAAAVSDVFTIARVNRPRFLRTWELEERTFDVDFMVCTDLEAARTIVDVVGLQTARDVDSFAGGLVQATEFEIPAESPIAGQTVEATDRFQELTFAAVFRDEDIIIPRGDTIIRAGDEVVVIGSPENTRAFSTAIAPREAGATDIVIVGGSEIGYQTARLLERRGFTPRFVERDAERARWLAEQLPDTTVMEQDATDREFLDRENVGEADVLVAALENDQQNLLATLLADRLGTNRTVAVVATPEFTDLFEAVGVDVAVSPREATAEEISRFTRGRRMENLALIEGDRAEVIEVEIGSDGVAGRTISDIASDFPEGVVIGAITRDGKLVTPRGETVLEAGDHVVVFADRAVAATVTEQL